MVDGQAASDVDRLQTVCDCLELELALADLGAVWSGVGATPPGPDRSVRFAVFGEQADVLEQCSRYAESCQVLAESMAAAPLPIPEPDWVAGQTREWLEVVDAVSREAAFRDAKQTVEQSTQSLNSLRHLHDAHPVVQALLDAVRARDIAAYSRHHAAVVAAERTRLNQQQRMKTEEILEKCVPGLVDRVNASLQGCGLGHSVRRMAERMAVGGG